MERVDSFTTACVLDNVQDVQSMILEGVDVNERHSRSSISGLPGVPQKALPKTKKRSDFHQKLPSKNGMKLYCLNVL